MYRTRFEQMLKDRMEQASWKTALEVYILEIVPLLTSRRIFLRFNMNTLIELVYWVLSINLFKKVEDLVQWRMAYRENDSKVDVSLMRSVVMRRGGENFKGLFFIS